jgi:hypothetical protein
VFERKAEGKLPRSGFVHHPTYRKNENYLIAYRIMTDTPLLATP